MERIGVRRDGKYYMREWKCPTSHVGDNPILHAMLDPTYNQQLAQAESEFPSVVEKIRDEYQQLKRDIEVKGKEVA